MMLKGAANEAQLAVNLAYAHGFIQATLNDFAKSFNISQEELTTRMGELLLNTSSGKIHRAKDRVSALSGSRTEGDKTTRKMEMASSTHSDKPQKAYWAAMTPKQRSDEIKRRMSKWPSKAKKAWKKGRAA